MRTFLSVSLAIAVACYAVFAYVAVDRRSDEAKIRDLINDTLNAVNKRDLGSAMRCVSENYTDEEGLNRDRLRVLVAQTFRAEPEFTATADVSESSMQSDTATVALRAVVKTRSGESIYDRGLVLSLRKESARRALILPTEVWRVVSVEGLGLQNQL